MIEKVFDCRWTKNYAKHVVTGAKVDMYRCGIVALYKASWYLLHQVVDVYQGRRCFEPKDYLN